MRKSETRIHPHRPARYTAPTRPAPPARAPVAVIAELMQKRPTPTRSREEQAFIDLQRGCHQ